MRASSPIASSPIASSAPASSVSGESRREVSIPAGGVWLEGEVRVPAKGKGMVLFVHGSGSSRHSPRNQYVAGVLGESGMATLLFDLLTTEEEREDRAGGRWRFDIELLTGRLLDLARWIYHSADYCHLPVGLFGASTGAAAALRAAAELRTQVSAVVSRGGRPDLAGAALESVTAPTLLIVGGNDDVVLRLNQEALERLHCEKRMHIVPGATHLFEEAGTLEEAARTASQWFQSHFQQTMRPDVAARHG